MVAEVALEGQGLGVQVLAPGQDAGGDAPVVGRRDDHEVVFLARLQDRFPHVLGMEGGVPQVDLIALLARETGLRDDHVVAGNLGLQQPVVRHGADHRTEQVDHQGFRLGPLNLYRRDVDLGDLDVEFLSHVDALQPEHDVGIGKAEPELVLEKAQQNGVVQDAALLIAHDHVLGSHGLDAGGIAGDHVVDERLGVRADYLDLALDGDVPHGDMIDDGIVLDHGAAVLGTHVAAWVVHAVIDRRQPTPGLV